MRFKCTGQFAGRICSEFGRGSKIAEAVLIPVYGKDKFESERPFKAHLKKGIWTVVGTLPCQKQDRVVMACVGGLR